MASIQRLGGGATGAAGPIAARQFLDQPGQSRFTQPSVLTGVGTGLLAGGLFVTDVVDLPVLTDEFLAAHAITATPLGLFYAAFPATAGSSATQQLQEQLLGGGRRTSGVNGGNGGNGGGSASTEVMVQGHNPRNKSRRGSGSGY